MKLDVMAYPIADPVGRVAFVNSWQYEVHPVLLWRSAALVDHVREITGKPIMMTATSGRRSFEEQIRSYKSTGGYQDESGEWVGGNGKAAIPGRSWHEFGCAMDDGADKWFKQLNSVASSDKQTTLRKFGLFKPLTPGNGTSVFEDWHYQPIETREVPVKDRKAFLEYLVRPPLQVGHSGEWVQLLQAFLTAKGIACGKIDGVFGPKTQAAVLEFQHRTGLQADGIVGAMTWRRLLYNK